MSLSKHEEKMLKQIESALSEDSSFIKAVDRVQAQRFSPRRVVLSGFTLIIGIFCFILGLVVPIRWEGLPVISVLGFLLVFGGIVYYFRSIDKKLERNPGVRKRRNISESLKATSWINSLAKRFTDRFYR